MPKHAEQYRFRVRWDRDPGTDRLIETDAYITDIVESEIKTYKNGMWTAYLGFSADELYQRLQHDRKPLRLAALTYKGTEILRVTQIGRRPGRTTSRWLEITNTETLSEYLGWRGIGSILKRKV